MREKEGLKTLLITVAVEAWTHATKLRGYLEGTIISLKKLEEEMIALKNDLVETFNQYFERESEYITFFY